MTNIQLAEEVKETQASTVLTLADAASVHRFSPIEDPRWSDFVSHTPEASLFHSVAWLKALAETYGYQPIAFTTSSPGQKIENGLVFCVVDSKLTGRRAVSVPFSDYCQPLTGSKEELTLLLRAAEAEVAAKGWRYFEVRPLIPTGNTMAETALRFILSNRHVGTTIPGMRKLKNVEANCAASGAGPLPAPLLKQLRGHRWDRNPTSWSQ